MTMPGFWRNINTENRRAVLSDLGALSTVHFLFPQGGGPRGAFTTFADLAPNLQSRDTIILGGVLREQAVTPDDICDVTVYGAANRPRQATSGGVPTGGGAYWTYPSSSPAATTPLIEVVAQGWTFENICFNPYTSSGAIRVTADAVDDSIDGGHLLVNNCYFVGGGAGQLGIENNGGSGFCKIQNSRFLLLASAIKCLSTSKAVPLAWEILDNWFAQNTNDIVSSLSYSYILRNQFMTAGAGAVNKVISTTFNAVQGGNNHVCLNQFSNAEAEIAPGSGFTGAASDTWMNYVNDQAALAFGQPA